MTTINCCKLGEEVDQLNDLSFVPKIHTSSRKGSSQRTSQNIGAQILIYASNTVPTLKIRHPTQSGEFQSNADFIDNKEKAQIPSDAAMETAHPVEMFTKPPFSFSFGPKPLFGGNRPSN